MSQLNLTELLQSVNTDLPDNVQRLITPSKLRGVLYNFLDSLMNLHQKLGFDYYSPIKEYNNNDVTLYGDQLFKKINGSGTGVTPINGVDWLLIDNPFATEDLYGVTKFADEQQTLAGVDDKLAVNPKNLKILVDGLASEYTGGNGVQVDNINSLINFVGKYITVDYFGVMATNTALMYFVNQDGKIELNASEGIDFVANGDVQVTTSGGGKLILSYIAPTDINKFAYIDANKKVTSVNLPTEFSYTFSQNLTITEDLLVDSVKITNISKTVGIDTVELNVNGGGYFDVLAVLPYTIPSGAEYLLKISYNLGYNSGVVSFKGEKI